MEGRQIGQQRWDDKGGLSGTVFKASGKADGPRGVYMEDGQLRYCRAIHSSDMLLHSIVSIVSSLARRILHAN